MNVSSHNGRGATLLFIMGMIAFFVLIATVIAQTAGYGADVARLRIQYERQYRAAESLLYYGISALPQVKQRIPKRSTRHVGEWLDYQGCLITQAVNGGVRMRSEIYQNNILLAQVSCYLMESLTNNGNKEYQITQWKIGTVKRKKS